MNAGIGHLMFACEDGGQTLTVFVFGFEVMRVC